MKKILLLIVLGIVCIATILVFPLKKPTPLQTSTTAHIFAPTPSPTLTTLPPELTKYIHEAYNWVLIPVSTQTLSENALYVNDTPVTLHGQEWLTHIKVTQANQDPAGEIEDALLQDSWISSQQQVAQGSLIPIQADGPLGGVHGYMKISGGMIQVIIIATQRVLPTSPADDKPLQQTYPYSLELRIFMSDPTPLTNLFHS